MGQGTSSGTAINQVLWRYRHSRGPAAAKRACRHRCAVGPAPAHLTERADARPRRGGGVPLPRAAGARRHGPHTRQAEAVGSPRRRDAYQTGKADRSLLFARSVEASTGRPRARARWDWPNRSSTRAKPGEAPSRDRRGSAPRSDPAIKRNSGAIAWIIREGALRDDLIGVLGSPRSSKLCGRATRRFRRRLIRILKRQRSRARLASISRVWRSANRS